MSLCVRAQLPNAIDSNYVTQFKRQNNIQLNTWFTNVDYTIQPPDRNPDHRIRLAPNVRGQAGVSFGLKKITLFAGFQIPGTESDPNRFGKTKYTDFSFAYYKDRYGAEIYFRNYNGLHSSLSDSLSNAIREDVQLTNFGISFYLTFSSKFSYRSAIAQQEQQTKSSGTFALMANANYRGMSADTGIIPKNIDNAQNYGALQGLLDLRCYVVNLRPGYAHNFVAKKGLWFFSPSAFAGIGVGNYEFRGLRGIQRGTTVDFDLHGKLSAGYNHRKVFWNVYMMYDQSYNIFSQNSLITLRTVSLGVNIGYRLNSYFGIKWL